MATRPAEDAACARSTRASAAAERKTAGRRTRRAQRAVRLSQIEVHKRRAFDSPPATSLIVLM